METKNGELVRGKSVWPRKVGRDAKGGDGEQYWSTYLPRANSVKS